MCYALDAYLASRWKYSLCLWPVMQCVEILKHMDTLRVLEPVFDLASFPWLPSLY